MLGENDQEDSTLRISPALVQSSWLIPTGRKEHDSAVMTSMPRDEVSYQARGKVKHVDSMRATLELAGRHGTDLTLPIYRVCLPAFGHRVFCCTFQTCTGTNPHHGLFRPSRLTSRRRKRLSLGGSRLVSHGPLHRFDLTHGCPTGDITREDIDNFAERINGT